MNCGEKRCKINKQIQMKEFEEHSSNIIARVSYRNYVASQKNRQPVIKLSDGHNKPLCCINNGVPNWTQFRSIRY